MRDEIVVLADGTHVYPMPHPDPLPARIEEIDLLCATPGPWDDEPDAARVDVGDVPALIARGWGHFWCGYIGVWTEEIARMVEGRISVHGGWSFVRQMEAFDVATGLPNAKLWWCGFDCGHAWDINPRLATLHLPDAEYRDLVYAATEVVQAAKALSAMLAERAILRGKARP